MNRLQQGSVAVAAVAVLSISLSACGSGDGGGTANSAKMQTVKAIVAPTVDVAPLYLGKQRGIFAKHGIDLQISLSPTPSGRVPALISGAADVAFVGTADVLQAISAGVPLEFIGATTITTTNPSQDTGKVYVAHNSPITDPAQLNGKTVAVGSLKGGGELSLRAALDQSGADSSSMKFVELPLDSMYPALESGRVDAISEIAPFTNVVEQQGARYLLSPGAEATPNAIQTAVAATKSYVGKNSGTVDKLLTALKEAVSYAKDHTDQVRSILPTYSKTPKDLASSMTLPIFSSDLSVKRVSIWADLMYKYRFIKSPVDVKSIVWQP